MYIDFMIFTLIALVTDIIILISILSSNIKYREKGFIQIIILAICHSVIDAFWGLTYYDMLGLGTKGLYISTVLYFISNSIISYCWFLFLYGFLHKVKPKKRFLILSAIPMAVAILMAVTNFWTDSLFTIGNDVSTYARGRLYIIERVCTTGYIVAVFIWSLIKFFESKEKGDKKRCIIILAFAFVPMVFDIFQMYFFYVPCTSVEFQVAILIIYAFVSIERKENVLLGISDRQKSYMKTALAQTSMSWYEFNVDRDCVYDSKIYIEKGHYIEETEQNAESYSVYYNFFAESAFPKYRESYREMFSVENLKNSFEKGESELSMRFWIKDFAGDELYIIQNVILTQDSVTKDVIGFAYIRDITSEERQNKLIREARITAERANKAKTAFLFNMSHDIRTPMNAIIGFTDLLEKYQDNPQKRADYIKKIKDSNKVLLSIINNVLEIASIEKGKLELEETAWSAEQFVDSMYSVFADMMAQKNIEFTSSVDVKNNYIFCDVIKLREIFINILLNACKYTEPGGKVSMCLEEIPSDKEGYVLFKTTFSDTGIGMSEDFIEHIFEEFAREKSVTDSNIEGTGLGMPIVKRLVDFLGGSIEVNSKQGVGSEFIVTIPHKIADKSNIEEVPKVEIESDSFHNKRILLAEDNELNAEIAMEILKEAGFEIEWAKDGQIAVDMLKSAEDGYYNIIIMDVQMPNMNGYEATKTIRKLPDTDKANIPILAMTANAFKEDKKDAVNAGMNGHLGKPIDVNELMNTLARLIK